MNGCQFLTVERAGLHRKDGCTDADKCGAPTHEHGPYCAEHRAVCFILSRAERSHEISRIAVVANHLAPGVDAKTFIASV